MRTGPTERERPWWWERNAAFRRLVRIDIQTVTLGRGSETSLGMMLYGGLGIV